MIKSLRRKPAVNKIIRSLLKQSAFQLADNIKNYIVPRWRIAGEVDIKIDDTSIKMFSDCDDNIVDLLYYNSDAYSEIEQLKLFARLSLKSDFVLDIGANTGFYSVLAAAKNSKSEIWAFEPYFSNLDRLKRNILLNDLKNVVVMETAVGNKHEILEISVPQSGQICDSVSADAEFSNTFYTEYVTYQKIEVEQVRLDDLTFKNKIDLMKIDVENHELAVFEGAVETLKNMSPIIQCEMFVDDTKIKFYEETLKPLGYNCYMMLKNGLAFTDILRPNLEGRDFLFTKRKLSYDYVSYKDDTLPGQLMGF